MTYSATIKSKAIANGKLVVVVTFEGSDGSHFDDTYETTQRQPANWPIDVVQRRLAHMNEMPGMLENIKLEPVPAATIEEIESAPTTDKDKYREKLELFERYVSVISKGLTTDQNAEFVELKKWLTDNFRPEFIELF